MGTPPLSLFLFEGLFDEGRDILAKVGHRTKGEEKEKGEDTQVSIFSGRERERERLTTR